MSQRSVDTAFIRAAKRSDVSTLLSQLIMGADINCRDTETGATALHYVTARRIRSILKQLIRFDNLDFLVKDHKGRLPSDLAFEVARDPVMGRYLVSREIRQAKKMGIDYKAFLTGRESPRVDAGSLV